ncbi:hypothetical protein V5799_003204 [Amblyomma americanum]|uniref:Uncharacterized protein n=1 Tax=Amblyomma americanum TaxID=6943 RepID=A0AAQ4D9M7_AMBAM
MPSTSATKPHRASKDAAARRGKVRSSISAQSGGTPDAVALETMATGDDLTPDISGSDSMSSVASMDGSVEIRKKGKKPKRSGKKSRKRRQEGGRGTVVVINRTNILRDPFYVCVGRPFLNDEEEAAPEPNPGCEADKVVAYVTSTNVDGCASAAIEKAELIKEKAMLDAVLRDLIELLELHSVRQEKSDAEAGQPNGLIGAYLEKKGDHFSKHENMNPNVTVACRNEREAIHPNIPVLDANLAHQEHPSPVRKQAMNEGHPPQCIVTDEVRQGMMNNSQMNQDNTCGHDQRPASSGTAAAFEHRKAAMQEHTFNTANSVLKVYEAPFAIFSMSLTDSSDRNQPAPSKDSSGYLGGSETEPVRSKPDDDDNGFLDMAFGAGSFTEDYGLGQLPSDGENPSSPTTVGGGCNTGCLNNLLRPITMVSKYIQTDCWDGPASESSFSEVVRQTSHHKSSTKILQRPCSMQISVPQRRAATGGGSGGSSSAEELEKIFAAYSPPSKPGGKDASGRADLKKGMLRDRNFNLPSSAEGGADTAPPSTPAGVAQQCAFGGGSQAVTMVEEGPAK